MSDGDGVPKICRNLISWDALKETVVGAGRQCERDLPSPAMTWSNISGSISTEVAKTDCIGTNADISSSCRQNRHRVDERHSLC